MFDEKYPAFSNDQDSYELKLEKQRELLKQLEAKVNKKG